MVNKIPSKTNFFKQILLVGQVIKNYKILCKLLNEPELNGNSKIAQHKEWERYFSYIKEGQKYIITEIYDSPIPKQDLRSKGNNSEYVQHIELLLLNYLSKQTDSQADFTNKNLFLLLGMVNQNYTNESYRQLIEDDEYISEFQVNHFFQRSYNKLNTILYDSLRNLSNRRLITVKKDMMIKIGDAVARKAIDEEINLIRDTERAVLLDMGLESMVQVHLKFKNKPFYKEVYRRLADYNIAYYYTNINIMFTHSYINEALEKAQIQMQRNMLNDKVVNAMNTQADNNLERNHKKYDEFVQELIDNGDIIGKPNSTRKTGFFRYDDVTYIYAQKKLSEYLMRINGGLNNVSVKEIEDIKII